MQTSCSENADWCISWKFSFFFCILQDNCQFQQHLKIISEFLIMKIEKDVSNILKYEASKMLVYSSRFPKISCMSSLNFISNAALFFEPKFFTILDHWIMFTERKTRSG